MRLPEPHKTIIITRFPNLIPHWVGRPLWVRSVMYNIVHCQFSKYTDEYARRMQATTWCPIDHCRLQFDDDVVWEYFNP